MRIIIKSLILIFLIMIYKSQKNFFAIDFLLNYINYDAKLSYQDKNL